MVGLYIVYITCNNYIWCSGPYTKSILDPCSSAGALKLLGLDGPLFPEAGFENEKADQEKDQVLTTFVDEEPGFEEKMEAEMDDLRGFSHVPESDIAEFFSRPVKIFEHDWNVDAVTDYIINPWDLWLRNKRVANRITNYRNFSATLCVKVMLNGNQFYWGSALLSYAAGYEQQRMRRYENKMIDVGPASQRIHLWLEPTTNEGGCMRLPFVYPNDALSLPVASEEALENLGVLWFDTVSVLQHDSTTKPIKVTYYAWAENVTLSGPTQFNLAGLVPQSGDEFSRKPISSVATSVASMAGKLAKVPPLAPYALSTQTVANAIGTMASALGYSKPSNLQEPMRVRKQQFNSFAVTDGSDECDVTALTQKHEVTIDPRTVGLGSTDEMEIEHICNIESYIGTATWQYNAEANDILVSVPVSPFVSRTSLRAGALGAGVGTIFPPCGHIGRLFDYWRADMIFRFRVVANKFHKGRLLIVWDPHDDQAIPESNLVHSMVVDIAETRDFEIKIGWGSHYPALRCLQQLGSNRVAFSGLAPVLQGVDNGALTVYVLNDLVSSTTSTRNVGINVFVRAENVDFWAPDKTGFQSTYFPLPEAGNWDQQPNESLTKYSFGATGRANHVIPLCAGERVTSLRTLLKRYCHDYTFQVFSPTAPGSNKLAQVSHNLVSPVQPGWDPTGGDTIASRPGNAIYHSFWSYLEPLYVATRGGRRVKVRYRADLTSSGGIGKEFVLARTEGSAGVLYTNLYSVTDPAETRRLVSIESENMPEGAMIATTSSDGTGEITVPYYSFQRFFYTQSDPGFANNFLARVSTILPENSGPVFYYSFYSAANEDYSLFMWNGTLPLWDFIHE